MAAQSRLYIKPARYRPDTALDKNLRRSTLINSQMVFVA
jgi:hypothetical protein